MNKKTKALILSMIPKWVAMGVLIGIIVFNFVGGQTLPELVPYQIVPLDPVPDCRLEVGIELIHPYRIENLPKPQKEETLQIIYKRIAFEISNPNKQAGMFEIDGQLYHLIRIPYTAGSDFWGWDYE